MCHIFIYFLLYFGRVQNDYLILFGEIKSLHEFCLCDILFIASISYIYLNKNILTKIVSYKIICMCPKGLVAVYFVLIN